MTGSDLGVRLDQVEGIEGAPQMLSELSRVGWAGTLQSTEHGGMHIAIVQTR